MHVKGVETERFQDYKYPSMLIAFPKCSFKCDKECGRRVCQNSALASAQTKEISTEDIVWKYLTNPITKAVICGGLEPFDSFDELVELVSKFREAQCDDDIVIYTGYRKSEISEQLKVLAQFQNIVVKFGRFVPDKAPHYDQVLGVQLANDEQYGERIS